MHKKLPAGPSRRLLFKYNTVNFVNADICGGINPVYGVKVEVVIVYIYINRSVLRNINLVYK